MDLAFVRLALLQFEDVTAGSDGWKLRLGRTGVDNYTAAPLLKCCRSSSAVIYCRIDALFQYLWRRAQGPSFATRLHASTHSRINVKVGQAVGFEEVAFSPGIWLK